MPSKLDTTKFTPLFRQWLRVKQELPEALVLFRLGDFYEMFGDDAEVGARELQLTLTSRECSRDQRIPMCGVPHHALNRYLRQLVQKGYRVAVVEQTEDPKRAKGLVRREVTRVVTRGTVMEDDMLPGAQHNFLASVARAGARFGLAVVDVSTGDFLVTELEEPVARARGVGNHLLPEAEGTTQRAVLGPLLDELGRLQPAEVLLSPELGTEEGLRVAISELVGPSIAVAEENPFSDPGRELREFFGVLDLAGYGCEGMPAAQEAAAQALRYLQAQRPSGLPHFAGLSTYSPQQFMLLDIQTRRNLELERTLLEGRREGSLLGLLDRTRTPMGSRELRQSLLQPLVSLADIQARLDAVEELVNGVVAAGEARDCLRQVYDLERLTARVTARTANPRDLRALADSLERLPGLKAALGECRADLLVELTAQVDELPELTERLRGALADDPPAQLTDGGIMRSGYSPELDELRDAATHGREWIAALQHRERERTGIKSLRVGYNQVFGYYIEVTKANLGAVPSDYERKQTLTNAERFVTPELKEMEAKILGAEERARELEHELFVALRDWVAERGKELLATARALARIDMLLALAEVAVEYGYCKPEVHEGEEIEIRDGRHPVVERLQTEEPFVPNDCYMDCGAHRMIILTGPNMAGKSTYLRQVALIALMAQMGSFVPARSARVGLVDRIFTRVGASDDLATGRSTFMIEMTEAANILNNATDRSLIILDEIGRGTSTYDGLSIAWAMAEYIAREIGARTLFATHYHHLNELAEVQEGVRNFRIAVKEEGDRVVFLRKIMPGGTDRSYGVQVARLAGLPEEVIARAKEILRQVESEHVESQIGPSRQAVSQIGVPVQLQLFDLAPDPVVEEIRKLDLDTLSPIEALMKLKELKDRIETSSGRGQGKA